MLSNQDGSRVIVKRTAAIAAAAAAVAAAHGPQLLLELLQLGQMVDLAELLVDQGQRGDDATVEGHDALTVAQQRLLHEGDVVHAHRGRLLAVRQEVGRHFAFAFDFDATAALELVRLVAQHLVHFFRHL